MKIKTTTWCLSLMLIAGQQFLYNSVYASNMNHYNQQNILTEDPLSFKHKQLFSDNNIDKDDKSYTNAYGIKVDTQTIKKCPRKYTNWELISTFETENYSLALCQQNDLNYLVGHKKQEHEAFISAKILYQNNNLIIAQDEYGFYFEINHDQLKITQGNKIIAQENIVDSNIRQKPKETTSIFEQELANKENSESSLTQVVWQLQEIRYNNDKLIEVDNPSNYTIEFLPDGQLSIKADCNRARGNYTQEGSSISIEIGATTRAMCPPESISDQYLKELQSATIFFFQDDNLYIDLKFDTGTMKFIADIDNIETKEK